MITEILNYSIVRKLGEGSMGQVYLAKNKSIHQFVAVKVLNPRYSNNPVLREKFRQEAIMLSALNHPNIVKFLNYVENENGIFLIMEYVDGMTLEDYLSRKTGLMVEEKAFPLMLQILDAFEYAHDNKMVHRDIKPSNIFVTREGNIKILDFGIAQILSESDKGSQNTYAGTVEYMSPEQVHGHPVDIRSDIYSLGVVFYQMMTGRHPYDTSRMSDLDIKKAIASEPLSRMKEAYPYVSDGAQALVDRATEKNPGDRYDCCRDIILQIRTLQRNMRGTNGGGTGGGGAAGGGGVTPGPVPPGPMPPRRNNLWLYILAGVLVVGGLCTGAYFLFFKNGERQYLDYVEKMGVAEGFGDVPSDNDTIARYRVSYKNGKLDRITLVDHAGQKAEMYDSIFSHYKPVETEYVYTAKGLLNYKNVYDSHSNLLYRVRYNDDVSEATVERPGEGSRTTYLLINDKSTGRLESIHYVDSVGMKTAYQGVYGEEYKYDKEGRLDKIVYLDENYQPTENQAGISIISFEYGVNPARTKSSAFDKSGKPVEIISLGAPVSAGKSGKSKYKEGTDSIKTGKRRGKKVVEKEPRTPAQSKGSQHSNLKQKVIDFNRSN